MLRTSFTNRFRSSLFLGSSLLIVPTMLVFAEPPKSPRTREQQEKLKERDRYGMETDRLRREGKLVEAVIAAEKMLAIERQVFGDVHEDVAGSLEQLAEMHEQREDFAAARKARRGQLAVQVKLYGEKDWRATDTRVLLSDVDLLGKLETEQRRQLREADSLLGRVSQLDDQGKAREALPLAKKALEIRRSVYGAEHHRTADAFVFLANLYEGMGAYTQAETLYRNGAEVYRKTLGDKHPRFAASLQNLATVYFYQGAYARAEPLFKATLEIHRQTVGDKHAAYGQTLNSLGVLYKAMGDKARAEPFFRQAVEVRRQALGEKHPHYARSLHSLAILYHEMGAYAKAERLYRQVRDIYKQTLGEKHPHYARNLHSLAVLYADMDAFARAEPIYEEVLSIQRQTLGEKHPEYAVSLNSLANLYKKMGASAKAEPLYLQALEIDRQTLGEKHPRYAFHLASLGELYHSLGAYTKAETLLRKAVEICTQQLGENHPGSASCLNSLALLYKDLGDYARAETLYRKTLDIARQKLGEKHPNYASGLSNLAELYRVMGTYAQAETLFLKALEIRKEVLGEMHRDYGETLSNLALLYQDLGDNAQAEALNRKALEIFKQTLGEQHSDYASSLNNLALLYVHVGDYARARPLIGQSLEITKQAHGEKHPSYAISLNNLAALYQDMGDYTRAEPLYRQVVEIKKQALGEKHPQYATGLHNLATLYQRMGDFAKAETLHLRALQICRQALGEQHPDCVRILINLGSLYHDMDADAKAEPLYQQALAISKKTLGVKHRLYSTCVNNLGLLYLQKGEYAQAEPLLQESFEAARRTEGEQHPNYATSLNNLALLYDAMGDFAQAEPRFRQAMALRKKLQGDRSLEYANSLNNLALLYAHRGDYAKAEPLYRQTLDIYRHELELTSGVQSQRQQLAMLRWLRTRLDIYLFVAPKAGQTVELQYRPVLAWKGAVGQRQRRQRLARRQPELAQDFAGLDRVSSQLAALALAVPGPKRQEDIRKEIEKLTEEKERLEGLLARRSAAFRKEEELRRLSPAQLQAALPRDTVLVDFLEYTDDVQSDRRKGRKQREGRLAAFVVRGDALVRVDLGRVQPIKAAVDAWRLALQRRFRTRGDDDLGAAVRRLVWQPLEEHLRGAKVVLISPDGDLARVPFAALPGSKKGAYLLEELALAVVPVPQLLPGLLTPRPADKDSPSLLLLGDVRYDSIAGSSEASAESRSAARGASEARLRWPALANTRTEMEAIANTFSRGADKGSVTQLHQAEATEAAVRKQAPVHRYLHFATHGYFAPRELRSALADVSRSQVASAGNLFGTTGVAGFHPGLLSGLVLAGANRPLDVDRDDGILTALEVEALDLAGVELATLSACETGLGEQAGGEGLLGLQRAFQVAGAHSVVAGLWQVDDAATRQLMVLFYDNLWRKKLPRLEALRQAQLWMLKEGDAWMRKEGISRGMVDVRVPRERLADADGRLPPYYWAAFTLSGDWR
jgi:tetratricopeptide (TPR) repeat protein/CHAT domain-containing protein